MEINLAKYREMKILVAVSGGRDSMALLHYLYNNADKFNIKLSVLNCDHGIRGESSTRDSKFVSDWCVAHKIPIITFVWDCKCYKSETAARNWRRECYLKALKPQVLADGSKWEGADVVATAHHCNDNAETVLFNISRGSSVAGLVGINDVETDDGLKLIRPLITVTREQIDGYIKEYQIPYVEDETNFTDDYTRNKIRHSVLPNLVKAVPEAVGGILRLSRLAADDEEYFDNLIRNLRLITKTQFGAFLLSCDEKVVFKRAAVKALKLCGVDRDYTFEHVERLYNLQFSETGKKFCFLSVTVYKDEKGLAFCKNTYLSEEFPPQKFFDYLGNNSGIYGGQPLILGSEHEVFDYKKRNLHQNLRELKFDISAIPRSSVIRTMNSGDKFKKFGGGTKNLGDFFTDKKIPVYLRSHIPVIAVGADILAVFGVEISEKVRVGDNTDKIMYAVSADYLNIIK